MPIPATVSADRAVALGERFEGDLPVESLERLAEFAPGRVAVSLAASRDAGGRGWLKGHLGGELRLTCQVCDKPFDWVLSLDVRLALARDEEDEERLLATAEPVLVQNDRLALHEVVEDEVLLGLPMMPKCAACENARPLEPDGHPDDVAGEGSTRPFAVLKTTDLSGASKARRK